MTPGRKFSVTRSLDSASFRTISRARGCFRFRVRDFLLRFMARKNGLCPPSSSPIARRPRSHSPAPGRSTLMTSAPMSPRNCVAQGPIIIWVKSRTRIPSSAIVATAVIPSPCWRS